MLSVLGVAATLVEEMKRNMYEIGTKSIAV